MAECFRFSSIDYWVIVYTGSIVTFKQDYF
jgi:hypothetical protein